MSIDWKSVANQVSKYAPLLGAALGGPAGAAAGGIVAAALGVDSDPAAVQQALVTNPDAAVKLRQIESDQTVQLQQLLVTAEANRLANDTAQLQSVNTTIQVEAKADHWPTYSWRPFIGFAFGFYIISLFVLPAFGETPALLSTDTVLAIGGILGIASWFRGTMQANPNIPTDNRG